MFVAALPTMPLHGIAVVHCDVNDDYKRAFLQEKDAGDSAAGRVALAGAMCGAARGTPLRCPAAPHGAFPHGAFVCVVQVSRPNPAPHAP